MPYSSLLLPQNRTKQSTIVSSEMALSSGHNRLKVLICAYACSPSRGSEYGVGWGWVEAISKYHDLWILTGAQCQNEIEAELVRRPELKNRMQFYYIQRTRYLWAEKFWPPAYLYTYKHQWQKAAYKVGKRLHKKISFDIVHQLTYIGFRVPGYLWKLNVPFVWGPIGGLEQTTWKLLPALGVHGGLYFLARNALNDWDRRFRLLPKKAFARADNGIIAATTGIQKAIKKFYGYNSTIISEIGLPPVIRTTPSPRLPSEALRLVWCGNHLPGKALPFLLEALQLLPANINWRLTIVGKGPCTAHWQKIARKQGVNNRCEWLGQVPRQTVLKIMQKAHVLVITSVYDLTSTVLVEALANGVPVICPNHCGFTDAITSECGIKVPASSKQKLVLGLRDAIVRLDNETIRFGLAKGALNRSASYNWDQKARTISDIYRHKVCFVKGSNSTSCFI
jgi:glycosyltransferase involved in cell wall biosynthesis